MRLQFNLKTKTMKTKVSETSRNCYFDHVKGFKENSQNFIIFNTIKRIQPCTGRMIQKKTGIEISDVARSLNNLWAKLVPPPIQISHTGKCKITGIVVKYYHINGAQLKMEL